VTLSYFVTMPQLSQYDLVPALDDPGTWRVFGGTLYSLISAALFSLGVGTLLRSTAASLTAARPCCCCCPASSASSAWTG
jgi:ABC-2 type transport system permease protein